MLHVQQHNCHPFNYFE